MNKEEINLLTIKLFLNYYKKDITERYAKCIDNIALDNDVLYTNEKVFITTLEKYVELQQENKELHNKIDKLLKENESLRTRIKTIKRLRKKQTQKKNKYKSIVIDFQKTLEKKNNKIDKAIKYINDRMIVEQAFCLDMKQCYELTEILKDSDVDD